MKKDPNRPVSEKPDYSLPRSKILRGRRNFQRLFEKSTVLNSNSIQFRYRYYTDPAEGCLIGFIVPKRVVKSAVKRNRMKRLMREVYRLHQGLFQDFFSANTFGFHGAFLAHKADLSYNQVRNEMLSLMETASERLQKIQKTAGAGKRPKQAGYSEPN